MRRNAVADTSLNAASRWRESPPDARCTPSRSGPAGARRGSSQQLLRRVRIERRCALTATSPADTSGLSAEAREACCDLAGSVAAAVVHGRHLNVLDLAPAVFPLV